MTNVEKCRPSQMSIRILLTILDNPGVYNRTRLAEKVGISRYRINEYIEALRAERIVVHEKKVEKTFTILPDESHKALRNMLSMDEYDLNDIKSTLSSVKGERARYYNRKLDSLYDFQKLGLRSLRKPHLDKIDKLQRSIDLKKVVILKNYRSNSNDVRDRKVECIIIHADIGTIQVYDPDKSDVRHFKLDRFDQVEILKESWQFEEEHFEKSTDHFRIADNDQVYIHLTLSIRGYNLMVDVYPKTRDDLIFSADNTVDYAAYVNHEFLGIAPFILANAAEIKVLEPSELRNKIIEMATAAREYVRNSHML